MIARWAAHYRNGRDGRKPLLPAGESVHLSAFANGSHQSWGKITSRPQPSRRDLELIAYRMGVSVSAVIEAMRQGLI